MPPLMHYCSLLKSLARPQALQPTGSCLPGCRVCAHWFLRSQRVEGFDVSAATENGILVANGQIAENTVSMAEAAVLFTLASLYDLHGTERYLRENLPRPSQVRARMLMGKTVGLIGFGKIGQAIAERLSVWGVRLVASVRTPRSMPAYVTSQSLDEVLATSDVVIMAASLTPESQGMLDLDALRRMKPDVVFVNITRGGIIPDDTLATLAAERPAMRLALDVFDPEPLKEDSPLRDLPNAILTPTHGGTYGRVADAPAGGILREPSRGGRVAGT